jgi:hypothetical protein
LADNVEADAGSGGATFRTLEDASSVHWPTCVLAYATTVGTPDVLQVVTSSFGLPVAQQGTWTVQPGNTANTTAWLVTGTGGTFPVTGTFWQATQPVSGTFWQATQPVSGPLTDAELRAVAVPVSGTFWQATQPISGTVTANAGTNLNTSALALESGGNLAAAATSLGLLDNTVSGNELQVDVLTLPNVTIGAAIPAGTNNIGDVDVLTVPADPFGVNADAASATGSISAKLRFIAATGIPITGTVTIAGAVTNAGTFAVQAAQAGTWTVQPGNTANSTPWLVTDTPATSGGLSMSKTVSAASTNATVVKASAGQVFSVQCSNVNAAARYLKLYNKATSPTVGTDVPVKTLIIPGNTAGAGFVLNWDKGLAFSAGIAFALTTGVADADTGAVAASELTVNVDYK